MAIIEGIKVSGYTRRKPSRNTAFLATTKALAGYVISERDVNEFVGNVLAMELEHALIEPLDGLDMPEGDKQRVRETGF